VNNSDAFCGGESLCDEPLSDLIALVTLDEDLAVLDRSAGAAMGFQPAAQILQLVGGTDESFDEGNGLACALAGVEANLQPLLFGRQAFLRSAFCLYFEAGWSRRCRCCLLFSCSWHFQF
jgi:hypothetical protein